MREEEGKEEISLEEDLCSIEKGEKKRVYRFEFKEESELKEEEKVVEEIVAEERKKEEEETDERRKKKKTEDVVLGIKQHILTEHKGRVYESLFDKGLNKQDLSSDFLSRSVHHGLR